MLAKEVDIGGRPAATTEKKRSCCGCLTGWFRRDDGSKSAKHQQYLKQLGKAPTSEKTSNTELNRPMRTAINRTDSGDKSLSKKPSGEAMPVLIEGLDGECDTIPEQYQVYRTMASKEFTPPSNNPLLTNTSIRTITSMFRPGKTGTTTSPPHSSSAKHTHSNSPTTSTVTKQMTTSPQDKLIKIGIFGTCDSGKSTLVKQLKIFYGQGIEDQERRDYHHIIINTIIHVVHTILSAMKTIGIGLETFEESVGEMLETLEGHGADYQEHLSTIGLAQLILRLREDSGFIRCLKRGHEYGLIESGRYLMENAERLLDNINCEPTEEDVLMFRAPTLAVAEHLFPLNLDTAVKVWDFGGYRHQRLKWSRYNSDLIKFNAIVYMHSLPNYDLLVEEDQKQNQLLESLQAFEELMRTESTKTNIPLIVLLNKRDVFVDKQQLKPFFQNIPTGFTASGNASENATEQAIDNIKGAFISRVQKNRPVYVYVTNIIDTTEAKTVLKQIVQLALSQQE